MKSGKNADPPGPLATQSEWDLAGQESRTQSPSPCATKPDATVLCS
jgi:hypothetical protein